MKAVVYHGVGDIRVDDVPEPRIEKPTDAIVRVTASAICGTDLHLIRGTMPGMKPGTILGHEAIGVVEEVGREVRNLRPGERVVVPSTIACGYCSYCRAGYYSQCDNANPAGSQAGTVFFGGPALSGAINGVQAEYARIPFASVGLVKLPDEISDDQAIFLSDIFPTGYFGAKLAEIERGDTVAVFGCGPVGQFAIASARIMGAGRIFAVDTVAERLEMARHQGAEVIDFNKDDPVKAIYELTGGIGVDRAIDAVGVDAVRPKEGVQGLVSLLRAGEFRREQKQVAPKTNPDGEYWRPGDAPSQALSWATHALAKAGTLSIIGAYPQTAQFFPLGVAVNRNLTVRMGNCNHRAYIPELISMVRSGAINPAEVLTQVGPLVAAVDAYRAFDTRQPGWIKVKLQPAPAFPT